MAERPLWILDDGRSMGGGQHFALRLLRFAQARGRDVRLIAPAATRVTEAASAAGVPTDAFAFPQPSNLPAMIVAARRLRGLLRTAPADALIVGNSARCQAVGALAARGRVICLMHEQDTAARRITPLLAYAGPVVATGANAQAAYAARCARPVAKVDNILGTDELDALVAARTPPPSGERPVLGVLGRLIPEKGVSELVDELALRSTSWDQLIVGGPRQQDAYAREVERRIAAHGLADRASLVGEVPDVPGFLAKIDVLVLPSTGREGQPTVILEALACGRPAVVRQPVYSADYEDLPVVPYDGATDLPDALARARALSVADPIELGARFTPQAVLDVLESVAR